MKKRGTSQLWNWNFSNDIYGFCFILYCWLWFFLLKNIIDNVNFWICSVSSANCQQLDQQLLLLNNCLSSKPQAFDGLYRKSLFCRKDRWLLLFILICFIVFNNKKKYFFQNVGEMEHLILVLFVAQFVFVCCCTHVQSHSSQFSV